MQIFPTVFSYLKLGWFSLWSIGHASASASWSNNGCWNGTWGSTAGGPNTRKHCMLLPMLCWSSCSTVWSYLMFISWPFLCSTRSGNWDDGEASLLGWKRHPMTMAEHKLLWWASIVENVFLRSDFFRRSFIHLLIHLSLGKAGPFSLESHIHVRALKMQGFPNNEMPY